jgi:NADH-quinone oxidoreductase subunit F
MRIESKDQFEALRAQALEINANRKQQVLVCCGTGCLASGSKEVAEAFASEIAKRSIDASVDLFVKPTGCHGFCERGPLVVLNPQGILYTKVKPGRVEEIVDKTLVGGEVIPGLLYKDPVSGERVEKYEEVPFYRHQVRVAMRNIGRIDPTDILDAIAQGAYSGVAKALFEMTPDASPRRCSR